MEYLDRIEQYKESMIKTLQDLIAIPSVEGLETADMPFGQEVHQALLYMLQKAEEAGFATCNVDNYAGHIEFGGLVLDEHGEVLETSDEIIGILGHLDVVPEGNHWDFPPFGGEISQGRIYGRGAIDDKGPVIAAFYAMKALKDSGFVPGKKVRLILGLDEETQWRSLTRYFQKEKAPSMGFTPDAQFPAISGEMGILIFDLAKKISKSTTKGLTLKSFKGGNAPNMVADFARVVVSDEHSDTYEKIRGMVAEFRGNTQSQIYVKGVGKSLEITAKGVSAHGARPGQGINAISILMGFLGRLSFANEDVNEFVAFYNRHIGFELDGTSLGCGLWDEPSGKLILNVGLAEMDGEAARLVINTRYPITLGESDVYDALLPIMNQYNLGIVKRKHQPPIRFEEGDPMIDALMEVYRKHTGDQRAPMVIGGGTYARATENIVAFGPSLPEDPEVAHQKNEYIEIDHLMLAAKIYADAIYRLAQI